MAVTVMEHGRTSSEYTYKFRCSCGCKFEAKKEDGYIQNEKVFYLLDIAHDKWLYVECPECGNECGMRLFRRWEYL